MVRMTDCSREDLQNILGKILGYSGGNDHDWIRLPPDSNKRILFIGLGGMGIETIDQIKGEMHRRFSPQWKNYVAFMGIDSDHYSFEKLQHLRDHDDVLLRMPAADWHNEAHFPPAWRRIVGVEEKKNLSSYMHPHSSTRSRTIGKMKCYDQI